MSRPSLWPLLPKDTRNSQVPGEPHPEQPALPSSPTPPPPGSGQTLPVALPRGPGRAHPSPALQGPQGLQPPAGPKTHHLPSRNSRTGPGLRRLRAGGCSSGALLSRGPSSPPHEATGPEKPALGLRHKLPSGPRPSRDLALPHAANGRALRRRRRPPGPCGPARGLRGSRSGVPVPASARPMRTLARQARARWLPARPDGDHPASPAILTRQPPGPEQRPAGTWARTGSEGGAAMVRVRQHARTVRRTCAGGRPKSACQSPPGERDKHQDSISQKSPRRQVRERHKCLQHIWR